MTASSDNRRIHSCPECGGKFRIPISENQLRVTCPHCRSQFVVPPDTGERTTPVEADTKDSEPTLTDNGHDSTKGLLLFALALGAYFAGIDRNEQMSSFSSWLSLLLVGGIVLLVLFAIIDIILKHVLPSITENKRIEGYLTILLAFSVGITWAALTHNDATRTEFKKFVDATISGSPPTHANIAATETETKKHLSPANDSAKTNQPPPHYHNYYEVSRNHEHPLFGVNYPCETYSADSIGFYQVHLDFRDNRSHPISSCTITFIRQYLHECKTSLQLPDLPADATIQPSRSGALAVAMSGYDTGDTLRSFADYSDARSFARGQGCEKIYDEQW